MIEHDCCIEAAARRYLGQVPHAREGRTVVVVAVPDVELPLLVQDVLRVLRGLLRVDIWHDRLQVLDVVLAVERAHLADAGSMRLVDVQLLVQAVAEHELVSHFHPKRLHWVAWAVID